MDASRRLRALLSKPGIIRSLGAHDDRHSKGVNY